MLMRASTENLRHQNRAIILASLRRLGPVSHTEISQWSGLSSATVSAITSELETEKVIQKKQQTSPNGRGRPRVTFIKNPDCAYIAAIRITSDRIEFSLADYAATLKDRFSTQRDPEDLNIDHFAAAILDGLEKLCIRTALEKSQIKVISITTKGHETSGRPILLWSPFFGETKIDFEHILRSQWPQWNTKILLTNEAKFAALASALDLQRKSHQFIKRQSITLTLAHSIGLGIASEEINANLTAIAPPFGHMVHNPDGPICRCGQKGCVEAYAGFYGIIRTAFEVPDDTIPQKFIPLAEMEKIAVKARQGDRMTQYAFRQAGEVLGVAIARVQSLFGPMPITVTGPGSAFYDLLEPAMSQQINQSLRIRLEGQCEIIQGKILSDLVYQGNIETCITELDNTVIAQRKL